MVIQELAQRAVLEALEAKIEALRALGEPVDGVTLELYFWDDLQGKHTKIFKEASLEDIVLALSIIEKESNGRFKLIEIEASLANRGNGIAIPLMPLEPGRPFVDVSNLYWKVQYSEKTQGRSEDSISVFILTTRELQGSVGGQTRSIPFEPSGVEYNLLRCLGQNEGFVTTELLSKEAGCEERTVRTEIGKLRRKANEKFGLGGENLIVGRKGDGYRLAKGIKIRK